MIAIITGGADLDKRYFERRMCREELKWAIAAGKTIVPVVAAVDKPNVGAYIAEGQSKGIDLSACDFKHFDRSNPTMKAASVQTILDAMKSPPKAKLVAAAGAAAQAGGTPLLQAGAPAPALGLTDRSLAPTIFSLPEHRRHVRRGEGCPAWCGVWTVVAWW